MTVKPGDMFIADAGGHVLSAIITGPSGVARIGPTTTGVLIYVYAPPRESIARSSRSIWPRSKATSVSSRPGAEVVGREIVTA